MKEIHMATLRGRNPLGLFAALGALDVATRLLVDRTPRLRWTDDIDPYAVIVGPDDIDHLISLCLQDTARWRGSPVIRWPRDDPHKDLKVTETELQEWIHAVTDRSSPQDLAEVRLQAALLAEGGRAGKGDSKPTHFHFTAGRQLFLVMVRELCDALTEEHLREALIGPWKYESELPVLGWDSRGERIYALSGPSPATVKKTGVPGVDWLGFLGLRFFPITVHSGGPGQDPQVVTTGCSRGWKRGTFTWPLWDGLLSADAAASVVAHQGLEGMSPLDRQALGIHRLLRAPIRRAEQGGYGSFGSPEIL